MSGRREHLVTQLKRKQAYNTKPKCVKDRPDSVTIYPATHAYLPACLPASLSTSPSLRIQPQPLW